jgi:hypothetical protein
MMKRKITLKEFKKFLEVVEKIKTGKTKKRFVKLKDLNAVVYTLDNQKFHYFKKYNGAYKRIMTIYLWG